MVMKVWVVLCSISAMVMVSPSWSYSSTDDMDGHPDGDPDENDENHDWQACNTILAPSRTGWGVFAARSFEQGEVVEVAPLFVPISYDAPESIHTILDDYLYGLTRQGETDSRVVLFGMGMFYNHHPEPNLRFVDFGENFYALGFHALRDIEKGEELFTTYGHLDGGKYWFQLRHLNMHVPSYSDSTVDVENLPSYLWECCSKVYAGFGRTTLKNTIFQDGWEEELSKFHPYLDAVLGDARAKVFIYSGERIEASPGLFMSKLRIENRILGSLALYWDDLDDGNKDSLRILRQSGRIKVQYQDEDSDWERYDDFASFEDLAILPVGGNIGLVRRVGVRKTDESSELEEESNCRLLIPWYGSGNGSVTVVLELVATRDIMEGEILKLDLPPTGTREELDLLKNELDVTGQPYSSVSFPEANDEL